MDEVEIRDTRPTKAEERPKPVVDSSELDVHEIMHEVRAEHGHAILLDNIIQDENIAEWKGNIRQTKQFDDESLNNLVDGSVKGDLTCDIGIDLRCGSKVEIDDGFQHSQNLGFLNQVSDTENINIEDNVVDGNVPDTFQEETEPYIGKDKCTLEDIKRSEGRGIELCDTTLNAVKSGISEKELDEKVSIRSECNIHANVVGSELNNSGEERHGQISDLDKTESVEFNKTIQETILSSSENFTNDDLETTLYNSVWQSDIYVRENIVPVYYKEEANSDLRSERNMEDTAVWYDSQTEEREFIQTEKIYSNKPQNVKVIDAENEDNMYISYPVVQNPIHNVTSPNLLQKKDVFKVGYLYKQGGVDRNQGWKKRWFTLDEKCLKYYRDQKSSVSLRIIPVALMRSVSPANNNEQKSRISATTDHLLAPGRQHQFTLECKQRTFLFGTDTLENCQQWQSSLMAAIIENQKTGNVRLTYGGEMNMPDISGMVKFDNNKAKYFVALKENTLRYYHNLEDYAVDCPIHELIMERTSVKELRNSALQLDSPPDQTFVLHFDLENDAIQWKTYIETAISRALGDDKILKKVREKEDNRYCADCLSSDAEWASINLGIVLCTRCAGPHRSLGVNRSKVRSLRMDNWPKENENILQLLDAIGNKNANLFWFKNSDDARTIDEKTPAIIRQKHIEEKYLKKKFADILTFSNKKELNMTLYSAVNAGNIIMTMGSLFSGADMNFKCPGKNKTVLEMAKESRNVVLTEFLEQNMYTDVTVIHANNPEEEAFSGGASKKTAIYQEGYLDKTGPNLKGFQRRWCVLHYGRITYYSEKEGSERGFVDLTDAASVSKVTGQRKHSFDITLHTKSRTYRFAAHDEKSLGEWLHVVIQVISPFDFKELDRFLIAGYFYFKQQLTFWAKVWLVLQENALHIRHRDNPTIHVIEIASGMTCLQYNVGKHSEKTETVIKQLDNNHSIELMSKEGHVVAYIQGMTLKDTKKMFSLLEVAINSGS